MVCKEDVVSWFKELESYKRIDAMCTLLNMCLPFELRFIGTYLEELGKRDFQELRGAELRANNPTDLAADIGAANTDPRTRRKMALYVSLLRSCNYVCATTLYNVMVGLEQTGLLNGLYGDPLEELLLLYTMALHHPAFTFDQRSHFGEILEKLKLEDQRLHFVEPHSQINVAPTSCLSHSNITPNLSVPPPTLSTLGPPPGLVYMKNPGIQVPPVSGDHLSEIGNPPVALSNMTMSSTSTNVLPVLTEVQPPPGIPIPQYNMAEFVVGQGPWAGGLIMSTMNQPLEVLNYPPPPSPLVSQPSSPADSRASSPQRISTARPQRRRPSQDVTPPPPDPNPVPVLAVNFNTLTINEMRHMEDERLRELGMPPSAVSQLRSVEKLNGLRRGSGLGPRAPPRGPPSSGSDSGSSATSSPPGTPAPAPHGPGRGRPPAHYPFLPHFPRSFAAFPAYRPPPPPFANGELPTYAPAFTPVLYAQPKLSCWNCGGAGHAGHDCKEPSIEEVTRAGGYQLDFSTAPPDINDK